MSGRLLSFLSAARINPCMEGFARELALELKDWSELFRLADLNGVSLRIWRRMNELALWEVIPEDARSLAHAWSSRISMLGGARQRRAEWLSLLLSRAHEGGLEILVLDEDDDEPELELLVSPDSLPAASMLLSELAFQNDRSVWVSPDLSCRLRVRSDLCSRYSAWKPEMPGVWARRQPATVFGQPAFRLSREDALLRLCLRLSFYGAGVRQLSAIADLCATSDPGVDWVKFTILVTRWKAHDPAHRGLTLAQGLRPAGVPERVLEQLAKRVNPFLLSDSRSRAGLGSELVRFRSDCYEQLKEAYDVVRTGSSPRERVHAWATVWKQALWPDEIELLRMARISQVPTRLQLHGLRLLAPLRCWYALIREYDEVNVLGAALIGAGIVLRESVRWMFRSLLRPTAEVAK